MKAVTLESLAPCFQGLYPAQLFTCSSDGVPNVAFLSHVEYVDSTHVALSFQFFSKSRTNIEENPRALVVLMDPETHQGWHVRLKYVRSETNGPLFDRMALRIETIASYCGLKGIFRLRAADVYEVLSIAPTPEIPASAHAAARRPATCDPVFTMQAMQDLSTRIQTADTLEALVDAILEGIDVSFGFGHSMILLPSDEEGVLVVVATRGYPENGVGAEVRFGEGIGGAVAEARQPVRVSGLMRGVLYAFAMHRESLQPDVTPPRLRIPLPSLKTPESLLGVPLLVRGELVGVLCLESEVPYRFHEEDKTSLELLGSYLAIAIQNMQWRERQADAAVEADTAVAAASAAATRTGEPAPLAGRHEVVYYQADECLFVDGEYLIRGLPAKILWKLLCASRDAGRSEFTNRELRLDKSLNLPAWKDNLESRLLLLRRRLEQKCPTIRITPRARGRFALDVCREVALTALP